MKAACVVLMSLALACDGANPPTGPAIQASASAQTGTSIPVAGTFSLAFEPTNVRQVAGNTFIDVSFHEQLSGSILGTRDGNGTLAIHPDGTLNVTDTGFLTGTVAGVSGAVNAEVRAQGTLASVAGSVTIYPQTGTGGFVGLQGVVMITGAATGPTTLAGSYEGQLNF